MIDAILALLTVASSAIILWRAEPALNRMSPATPFVVRLAVWLLVVAACAQLVTLITGRLPDWPAVLLQLGVAALLMCERRLRVLVPRQRPPHRPADSAQF